MPKQGKYKKNMKQPSVALMLNINSSAKSVNVPSANNSDCEQSALKAKGHKEKKNKKKMTGNWRFYWGFTSKHRKYSQE